jgi:predicted transcriptional regulator of viral defense system
MYNNYEQKGQGGKYEMNSDLILELFQKNNGILKAKQINELGIDNKVLQRMAEKGQIERIGKGLYLDANYMEDEYVIVQYRCTKGIFSHETALFFHDLSDRTPFQLMMTIPAGYNTRILKETDKYKFFYCKKDTYEIGITQGKTAYGNRIILYDKERTICDCIRKRDKLDADLVVMSVKKYMKEQGADFAKLLKYAEIFNIREKVKQYMEVLA